MDCSRVRELLSPYYDGELTGDDQAVVAEHLSDCAACSLERESFSRLSALVRSAAPAPPSSGAWAELEHRLDEDAATSLRDRHDRWRSARYYIFAAAAALLIAILGVYGHRGGMDASHRQMAADFAHYLEIFERDPFEAQGFLASRYGSQPAWPPERGGSGPRPAIAAALAQSYTIRSARVWDMPCCPCLQIVCQRSDGSVLMIFEHEEPQPMWFAGRSAMEADCGGKRCTVVAMERQLAATWKLGGRQITVVGARDLDELSALVQWLAQAEAA
jgi:hypothetical protein